MATPSTDEVIAAENARKEQPAANARQWLLSTHGATLCTTSAKAGLEGFPFGSIVPFCLTTSGLPVVFIASIAAHTANLRSDPRASLFVHDPDAKGDPQKSWRITVMGEMRRLTTDASQSDADVVSQEELAEIKARYEQRIPFAIDYNSTHDFSFWRMKSIERVRYIAGFGKICWLAGDEVIPAEEGRFGESARGAIDHMNADHSANLIEIARGLFDIDPKTATMTDLVVDGFYIRTEGPDRELFVPFASDTTIDGVRPAIIETLTRARAALA